jgi:hypothetical protein
MVSCASRSTMAPQSCRTVTDHPGILVARKLWVPVVMPAKADRPLLLQGKPRQRGPRLDHGCQAARTRCWRPLCQPRHPQRAVELRPLAPERYRRAPGVMHGRTAQQDSGYAPAPRAALSQQRPSRRRCQMAAAAFPTACTVGAGRLCDPPSQHEQCAKHTQLQSSHLHKSCAPFQHHNLACPPASMPATQGHDGLAHGLEQGRVWAPWRLPRGVRLLAASTKTKEMVAVGAQATTPPTHTHCKAQAHTLHGPPTRARQPVKAPVRPPLGRQRNCARVALLPLKPGPASYPAACPAYPAHSAAGKTSNHPQLLSRQTVAPVRSVWPASRPVAVPSPAARQS